MRRALITGAAGAIGEAIAAEVRRRWPGCALVLVDRDEVGLRRVADALGGEVRACDLSDLDALDALVDGAGGPIDLLVNCAGVMWIRSVEAPTWDEAWRLLAIDLVAPLRLMHRLAGEMGAGSVIVNVASMAALVPLRGGAWYGASKAGLAMASEIARADLAGRGVRVVTVYPGPVASALERGARADYGRRGLTEWMPMGQPGPLARRVVDAVERGGARVVYPSVYEVARWLPGLARAFALGLGPPPLR
ncbi:MAG TPA: SDR family NAD(P)-dependent oxidoreductase [Myxococcota bacterium]|nr:SDR family NAD(P)-dependent oxidoreductase [Myxococcota bacterium]